MCAVFVQCGDADAALDVADFTVEAQYHQLCRNTVYEPEAAYCRSGGRAHPCSRLHPKPPVMDREALAAILWNRPMADIARPDGSGWGFGCEKLICRAAFIAIVH